MHTYNQRSILIITLILLAIVPFKGMSQENLDYEDDVYPAIKNKSNFKTYSLLKKFQESNPEHANTYYQLALIAKEWAKEYDPFTEFKDVSYFIYHTKVYLGLCRKFIDKREARKNGELYQGAKKQDGNWWHKPKDIKARLDTHKTEIEKYEKNIKILRKYYNKSLAKYDKCVNIFRDINANYNKIKDIYLMADKNFREKTNRLTANFDSTLHYLDKYRTALNNYPLEGYDQTYSLAPVNTYRLQGLTRENFLKNNLMLWNYKSWTDSLYSVIENDIHELRKKIGDTEKQLNNYIRYLTRTPAKDTLRKFTLDRKTGFLIEKYDYQSLMLDMFKYKAGKIRYLSAFSDVRDFPGNYTQKNSYQTISNEYMKTVNRKRDADSLLNTFYNKIAREEVKKYNDFYDTNYGGTSGLKNFAKEENQKNNTHLKTTFEGQKQIMIKNERKFITDTAYITYNNDTINLQVKSPDIRLKKGEYAVMDFKKYEDMYYFTGISVASNNQRNGFIAKTNQNLELQWFKPIDKTSEMDETPVKLGVGEETIYTINHTVSADEEQRENYLLQYTHDGKSKDSETLEYRTIPRYFVYDDLNQTFLFAFKGDTVYSQTNRRDTLQITLKSASLDSTLWTNNIQLQGNLVDIIKMDLNYIVFCNYKAYKNTSGSWVKSPSSRDKISAAFSALIDKNGHIKQIKNYTHDSPFFLVKAQKINNRRINLQGIKKPWYNILKQLPGNGEKLFYMLTNSSGKNIYNNINKNTLR